MSFSNFRFLKFFFSLYSANINLQKKRSRKKEQKPREVSQAPIVYLNRLWFAGWSARLQLYTPTDSGSLGGQPGSYCIPQPTLVRWVVSKAPIIYPNQKWFAGWSARLLLYTPPDPGSWSGHYNIISLDIHNLVKSRKPTLVCWVVSQVPIVYPN